MTIIILLLGLVGGVLVGLLGIGGGGVLVPAMVYLLHMDQHTAQGTSLFVFTPANRIGSVAGILETGPSGPEGWYFVCVGDAGGRLRG